MASSNQLEKFLGRWRSAKRETVAYPMILQENAWNLKPGVHPRQGRWKQNRSGQASSQKMLPHKLFMRCSCPHGAFLHLFTFGCNTECSNFRINCKCNRPQANCKLAEDAVWTHVAPRRADLALQTFTNHGQSIVVLIIHDAGQKVGPAMAWLAGPLPPALRDLAYRGRLP